MSRKNNFKIGEKVKAKILDWNHKKAGIGKADDFKVGDIVEMIVVEVLWENDGSMPIFRSNVDNIRFSLGGVGCQVEILDEDISQQLANDTPGYKLDNGKPDLTDVPMEAMFEMGKAFTYGQKKYQKNNFRMGMKVSRQLAGAIRHIYQHLDGQDLDEESKAMHLGCAMANLAMAIYNLKNNPGMDDRFEKDLEKHNNGS